MKSAQLKSYFHLRHFTNGVRGELPFERVRHEVLVVLLHLQITLLHGLQIVVEAKQWEHEILLLRSRLALNRLRVLC